MTPAGAEPRRALRAWMRLPALLLVAVAARQIWLAHSAQLSPWSGGGFGMFSTTDFWARRHLHAVALLHGARRELEVPKRLTWEMRKALALPTEERLRALARELESSVPPDDADQLEAISIGVYAMHYDVDTLSPSGMRLRSVRVPAARMLRDPTP